MPRDVQTLELVKDERFPLSELRLRGAGPKARMILAGQGYPSSLTPDQLPWVMITAARLRLALLIRSDEFPNVLQRPHPGHAAEAGPHRPPPAPPGEGHLQNAEGS